MLGLTLTLHLRLVHRLRLGLYVPPSTVEPQEDEWVDIRPRWPLTDDKVSRGDEYVRVIKKKRVFTSLTTLTSTALQCAGSFKTDIKR